jgi:hypothetical protein
MKDIDLQEAIRKIEQGEEEVLLGDMFSMFDLDKSFSEEDLNRFKDGLEELGKVLSKHNIIITSGSVSEGESHLIYIRSADKKDGLETSRFIHDEEVHPPPNFPEDD